MKKNDLSIVIPCYNEEEALPLILPDLLKFAEKHSFLIIIVNDCSRDQTEKILAKFNAPNLFILHHKVNKGYGAAIKTGLLACTTEFAITIDADGQHDFEDILKLYNSIKIKNADMIIGSRKGLKSASKSRAMGKFIIRKIVNILIPNEIYDINSGMKIYKAQLGKRYINLCPNGMSFSDIIALVFINHNHLVIEEPISINKRLKGKSTINYKTAFETINEIFNIIVLFNPMKIFFPVSLLFFAFGIVWGTYFIFIGRGVTVGSGLLITLSVIIFLMGLIAEQLSAIRKSLSNDKNENN